MGVDQRQYLRVNHQQEIQLETASRLKLVARSENISTGGIGITCDQVTAQAIMPAGHRVTPDPSLHLSVRLMLGDSMLAATCSIQNSYRLAENSYSFNLKFMALEQASLQVLDGFMKTQKNDG
jgi:c-di-GMP-binding flagellar brake protein YcgR